MTPNAPRSSANDPCPLPYFGDSQKVLRKRRAGPAQVVQDSGDDVAVEMRLRLVLLHTRRRQQLNHLKIIRGVSTMRGLTWNRCRSMVRAGGGAGPLDESLVCWAGGRSACFLGVHTSTGGVPPQRCGLVYCHRYRYRTSGSTTMPVRSAARQARSLEGTLVGKTNAYSMWLSGGASS